MSLDWDKLRVFHAAAEAGSFTHAAETLRLSQSAISRQVSALEHDVGVPLFHRHARGLVLTEQGEMLFRTAHDVLMKLEAIKTRLTEAKDRPSGVLRVTTTVGLGAGWLTQRLHEFTRTLSRRSACSSSSPTRNSTSPCARPTARSGCASRSSPTSSSGGCSPCISTSTPRRPI